VFQANSQTPDRNSKKRGGEVKGVVVDGNNGLPMEFVNVALYKVQDSVLVTGTITKKDGKFSITGLKPGEYYVEVNFIGFLKKRITGITIKRDSKVADLNTIQLSPSNQELEGVEIVSDEDRIEYKIDRKVVNVSEDLNSSGGTAVDVLENTPSIEVDIEDNVSLRGSSSFTVLIDGKPTSLDANDVLKQMPASNIQQIEIITNPSVKYDPEGGAGIINIITKKRKRTGFNGIVNASGGNQNTYKGDFLLNYRTGKMNWYVGGEYSNRNYFSDAVMNRETYSPDDTLFIDSDRERVWKRGGKSGQAGVDYYITDDQTISLSTRFGEYTFGHDMESETQNYSTDDTQQEKYTKDISNFERTGLYWEATTSYDYQMDNNGQKLELSAFFSRRSGDEIDSQETYITDDQSYDTDGDPDNEVETSEEESTYRMRFNADYTLPIRKTAELEVGLQSKINEDDIDYSLDTYNPASGGLNTGDFTSRSFKFHQNIHSAYAIFSKEFSFMSAKAGLRSEYTDRELSNTDSSETYGINRIDLFPSLHLSKKFNDKNQLMASYSRRINRPRSWYLDPFLSYRDQYTLRKGNPDLEPEYTDSYELTYLRYFDKGFISLEAYFKETTNRIERVPQLYDDNIIIMSFQNVDKDQSLGSELMINMPVTDWFKLNTSGSYYNYKIFTTEQGKDVTKESNNWRVRGNTTFDITKSTKLQLTAFYSGPSVTSTGSRGSMFMTSLALRQDLLDDQMNIMFRVHDIFGTRGREMITDQPDYYVKMEHIHNIPRLSLGITYKINNFKRNKKDDKDREEMDMEF
ncbi:MAG: TonB-dependent receptor domain-containing protein, partial [Bacteroidales bacterium]